MNNFEELFDFKLFDFKPFENPFNFTPLNSIPPSCRYCNNHPSNGGSGVCFCILGLPELKC